MIQFFAPDISSIPELPEGESGHCCRVLRMKEGDIIRVTDGKGNIYLCKITAAHPKHTSLEIISQEHVVPRNYKVTLAVAPTKNSDRMEWLAEKAEEIGVDRIVLLKCERSERKNLRPERLQRILVSAMNQSLDAYLPELGEIISFKEFISSAPAEAQKFFGYCSQEFPKKDFVRECKKGGDVIVMIGPEGDFTQQEVALAVEKGFLPVTFGEKRLRTETAGVFAICAVNIINQL